VNTMNKFSVAVFFLLLFNLCQAKEASFAITSFNPGIRINYEFGENKGFILSLDLEALTARGPLGFKANTGVDLRFADMSFVPYCEAGAAILLPVFHSLGIELNSDKKRYYRLSAGFWEYLTYKKKLGTDSKTLGLHLSYPVLSNHEIDFN